MKPGEPYPTPISLVIVLEINNRIFRLSKNMNAEQLLAIGDTDQSLRH